MKPTVFIPRLLFALTLLSFVNSSSFLDPNGIISYLAAGAVPRVGNYVYARYNDPLLTNQIVAYQRLQYGVLSQIGMFPTYGLGVNGSTDPLGSQASLIFSPNKRWVLNVNPGSNTISTHKREFDGTLTFGSLVSSYPGFNSSTPVSLTAWGNYVYVLNVGSATSIAGFSANWLTGVLTYLPGSQQNFTGPYGQILFSPDGKNLILTGKKDHFRVFPLGSNFLPTSATGVITPTTPGLTPFALVFDPTGQYIVVALASGGVGTWSLNSGGSLMLVQYLNTTDMGTCWIARSNSPSNNVYTVNAGKSSLSGFTVTTSGTFTQINGNQMLTATTSDPDLVLLAKGIVPLDLTVTSDNQFVYVLFGGRGTIGGYHIQADGTLLSAGETILHPPGYNGLNGIIAD